MRKRDHSSHAVALRTSESSSLDVFVLYENIATGLSANLDDPPVAFEGPAKRHGLRGAEAACAAMARRCGGDRPHSRFVPED